MSTMLNFRHGSYANLFKEIDGVKNVPISNGTIYVTTDEKAMYVDLNNQRIRLGQIITCTFTEWQNLTPPYSTEAFYYVIDKNALLKYNASDSSDDGYSAGWVQINSTAELETAIGTLNTKLYGADGKSGDINSIKTDVATLRSDVDGLIGENGTIATIQNDISGLKTKDTEVDGELQRLEKKIDDGLAAAGSNQTVQQLSADMASVKAALSNENNELLDVSDIKATADSAKTTAENAVAKSTFETFKTENTSAIGTAKQEAINAAATALATYQTSNDNRVKAVEDDVSGLKTAQGDYLKKDGSVALTGDWSAGTHKISDVAAPVTNGDAANKAYVDAEAKKASDAASAADTKAGNAATAAAIAQTRADNAYTLAEGKTDLATVQKQGYAIATEVDRTYETKEVVAGVKSTADTAKATSETNKSNIATNAAAITAMKEGATITTFKGLEDKISELSENSSDTFATKEELASAKTAILGEENYKQTVKTAYEKAEEGVTNAAAALAEAQKKTTMADVEAKGYITMAQVEAKDYATKTEAQGYATAAAKAVQGDTEETVASVDAKAEKNKTDIAANAAAIDKLRGDVTKEIQAADAMVFEGTVSSEAELLAKTDVNKGDTYKAISEFKLNDEDVFIGDLLIATGEETNGVLTTVEWVRVPSGYRAEYVPAFSINDGGVDDTDNSVTLNLTSAHAEEGTVGDLGQIVLSAQEGSAVTISSLNTAAKVGSIAIGMAWGTF